MINYNVAPDFFNRTAIIEQICDKFRLVKRFSIGNSLCGRPIDALQIGASDNCALLCGGFHGTEYLTALTLLRFAEEFAEFFKRTNCKFGAIIIPCLNADGVEIALNGSSSAPGYEQLINRLLHDPKHWQANARGVDLNHNFDADWQELKKLELQSEISSPAPTRFGGYEPISEPETKALTHLCSTVDFEFAIALHSQGREIYYDFGDSTPPSSKVLANIFAEHSGYKISAPTGLAVGGGFKDWVIQKLKKPALTVEMGLGKNPLPLSQFEGEYTRIRPALFAVVNSIMQLHNKNE